MRYSQLEDLILECKPQSIIEIGTHHGARANLMVRAALVHHRDVRYIGYDMFDTATPDTNARELNGKGAGSRSLADSALADIVKDSPGFVYILIKGDTRETLHGMKSVADFVFIDGGHSVETIRGDYEAVKGSKVVVFDDFYLGGADTTKYGCNEVVRHIPHELLPKIDTFGENLRIQMAVIR